MNTINTDDLYREHPTTTTTIPRPEQEATRFVDIHVYTLLHDQDEQETRTIEATLDEISNANQPPDDDENQQEPSNPTIPSTSQPGRKPSLILLVCIGVVLLALLGKAYLYLLPYITPTTTITIILVGTQVQVTQHLTVVTGQADTSKDQLPGRLLSSLTITQAQTVPTTGKAHQDATSAAGTITFYNAAPYAQTLPMGMLLTGKSGMQYTIDHTVTIPAAVYPTFGQASVSAHAVTVGSAGDEPAEDIYGPCCLVNLSAVSSAFTGGQDERDYQAVSDQDISTTTTRLQTSLEQSAYSALQTQVNAGETMLEPLCTPTTTSNHQAGDEATTIMVTVNETCTALAYQTAALHDLIGHTISQQSAKLGASYSLIGDLDLHITQVHTNNQESATIQVEATQTSSYAFSQQAQQQLKNRIAGKTKEEATTLLLHTPGVQTVSINGDPGMTSMPTDTSRIHLLFLIG